MGDRTGYFEQKISDLKEVKKSPFKNYIRLVSFVFKKQFWLLSAYILGCIFQGEFKPYTHEYMEKLYRSFEWYGCEVRGI